MGTSSCIYTCKQSSSGRQVIGSRVITSLAFRLLGFFDAAMTSSARSRSVTMPTSFFVSRLSQIGSEPTFSVFINFAMRDTVSSGVQ